MPLSHSKRTQQPGTDRGEVARQLTDPCGKFLPALVYHDLRDRLRGHRQRARARWGAVHRPNAPGKLVWIAAGESVDSVRLGVELARAVHARRLDVSIMLTFEQHYPELLLPLGGSNRIAFDYAPADYAGCMHSVWRRLLPFAVILAGTSPRQNMIRLCQACRHAILVAPPASVSGRYERIYPAHATAHEGANIAPAADLRVLMLPMRTGSDIGRLADASAGRGLFLWHGRDVRVAKRLFALFRGHLANAIMLVSGPICDELASESPQQTLRLSTSGDAPLVPEKLVLVDDPALLSVVAADVWAAHWTCEEPDALWQALSAGARVTAPPDVLPYAPNARAVIGCPVDENALILDWLQLSQDDARRGNAIAVSQRAYAAERDLAFSTVSELLDRVCAWR